MNTKRRCVWLFAAAIPCLATAKDAKAFVYDGIYNDYPSSGTKVVHNTVSSGSQSFLSQVGGDLNGVTYSGVYTGVTGTDFSLGMYSTGNELFGFAYAVYPVNSGAANSCFADAGHGSGDDWEPLTIPSHTYNAGCWIQSVWNNSSDSWGSTSDYAEVEYGTYGPGTASIHCHGHAEASARCISYTNFISNGGAGGDGFNDYTDLGANQSGEVCLLRKIGGKFASNASSSGPWVETYLFGSEWYLNAETTNSAFADCIN